MIAAWKPPPPPTKQARLAAATRDANLKRARITSNILDDKAKFLTAAAPDNAQDRRQQLRQRLEARWAAHAPSAPSTATDTAAAAANTTVHKQNSKDIIVDTIMKADAKNWIHGLSESVLRRHRDLASDNNGKHATTKKQKIVDAPTYDNNYVDSSMSLSTMNLNHNSCTRFVTATNPISSPDSLVSSSHTHNIVNSGMGSTVLTPKLSPQLSPSNASLESLGERGQGECIGGKSHPHPRRSPRDPTPISNVHASQCFGINGLATLSPSDTAGLATLATNWDTALTSHNPRCTL